MAGDAGGDVSKRRLPSTPVRVLPHLLVELIGPPAAEVLVSKAHQVRVDLDIRLLQLVEPRVECRSVAVDLDQHLPCEPRRASDGSAAHLLTAGLALRTREDRRRESWVGLDREQVLSRLGFPLGEVQSPEQLRLSDQLIDGCCSNLSAPTLLQLSRNGLGYKLVASPSRWPTSLTSSSFADNVDSSGSTCLTTDSTAASSGDAFNRR